MDNFDGIIDLSHHNSVTSFHEAAAAGIKAVILKATQGTGGTDPKFAEYRKRAEEAGLLVGAYHFGNGSDPVLQARHFLSVCGNGVLVMLDCETPPPNGSLMTPVKSVEFAQLIREQTNAWPLFYTGQDYINAHLRKFASTLLGMCPPMVARYGKHSPDVSGSPWKDWSLWQFTSSAHVPGIVGNVDRSRLHAGIDHLDEFWKAHSWK